MADADSPPAKQQCSEDLLRARLQETQRQQDLQQFTEMHDNILAVSVRRPPAVSVPPPPSVAFYVPGGVFFMPLPTRPEIVGELPIGPLRLMITAHMMHLLSGGIVGSVMPTVPGSPVYFKDGENPLRDMRNSATTRDLTKLFEWFFRATIDPDIRNVDAFVQSDWRDWFRQLALHPPVDWQYIRLGYSGVPCYADLLRHNAVVTVSIFTYHADRK